jgi:hypothetical protein
MEVPKRREADKPHNNLRLGYCEVKDCKYSIRVIVAEIRLNNGRVVSICESCLDSLSANIKRYKSGLKKQREYDIIKIEE